jgi:hypothetical protein
MDERAEAHLARAKWWRLWAEQMCTAEQRVTCLRHETVHTFVAKVGCDQATCKTPWIHEKKAKR